MSWTPVRALIAAAALAAAFPRATPAQQPLSAIDWLENPLPVVTRVPMPSLPGAEPPVTESATVPQVTVQTLDEVSVAAVGLLPASVTGLPRDLWRASAAADLARALEHQDVLGFPAMQSLLYTLLLAEADPPADSGGGQALLQARIGKLLDLGAVEAAQALLERAGPETPALFPLWFDVSLLSGSEDAACNSLNEKPFLSRSSAARIYCAARGGDWAAAALIFDSARALGMMDGTEGHLIAVFLDPELAEDASDLPPPADISPLVFRLYEAAGTPLPTTALPRAFAMADLRDTSGWKAELEAAERLTRTGALSENRLMAYYTARHPAASGGIWDRVEAIQRFDTAMQAGDPGAVSASLPGAWRAMQEVHLELAFARFYAGDLVRLPLTGTAREIAFAVGLLSPDYEAIAARLAAQTPEERFLAALARGRPQDASSSDPLARTIARAFELAELPEALRPAIEAGRLGEAILAAMSLYASGAAGNLGQLETALRGLRALGLEDSARQASLQLMLLNQGF